MTQDDLPDCVLPRRLLRFTVFTEALTHGTIPWRGVAERRTCFYKFCPHAVAAAACYYKCGDPTLLSVSSPCTHNIYEMFGIDRAAPTIIQA